MGSRLLDVDEEIRQGGSVEDLSRISYEVLKFMENNPKTTKANITGHLAKLPLQNSTCERDLDKTITMLKALGSVSKGSLFSVVEDKRKITFTEPEYLSKIKRRKQALEKRIAEKQEELDSMGI